MDGDSEGAERTEELSGTEPNEKPPEYARLAKLARNWMLVGAVMGVAAIWLFANSAPIAPAMGVCALGVGGMGLWMRQRNGAASVVNAAFQRIQQGRFDEAEAMLASAERSVSTGQVRAVIALQRAQIALSTSRLVDVRRHADDGYSALARFALTQHSRMLRAHALGLRGFAEMSLGHVEAAGADAARAEADPNASPDTVAVARLVHAMALSRAERLEELAAHLRANGELLHEYTPTRMRAVVRGLEKRVRARKVSAYRDPAQPEDAKRTGLDEWVSAVAPEAPTTSKREYAPQARSLAVPEVKSAIGAAKTASKGTLPWKRVLVLWTVVILLFLFIWHLLRPTVDGPIVEIESDAVRWVMGAAIALVIVFTTITVVVLRQVRPARALVAAQRAAALGDRKGARAKLESVSRSSVVVTTRAAALLQLAKLDYHEAKFGGAVAHAEAGTALCESAPASTEVLLMPRLVGALAVARAAFGDTDGAKHQLTRLVHDHGGFSLLPSIRLRVLLLCAVRMRDFDGAAKVLEERTAEMTLTRAEELVADLVLARHGADRDEAARIADELRENPEVRAWIEAVAPDLVKATATLRVPEETAAAEDQAEREDQEERESNLTAAARRPG